MDVMTAGSSGAWLSCCKEGENVGKYVWGLFLLLPGSRERGWKLQTHLMCSICPGERWACVNLMLVRGG